MQLVIETSINRELYFFLKKSQFFWGIYKTKIFNDKMYTMNYIICNTFLPNLNKNFKWLKDTCPSRTILTIFYWSFQGYL